MAIWLKRVFIFPNIILAIVFLLAVILRFFQLDTIPYPLNGDEKALGYYAYSIFHFGTDEYGHKFPLYFPSIGDYKYPGYIYLSIPFVNLFGLSQFSTRFLSALLGSLFVILIYKLSLLLFRSKNTALFAAFITSVNPWALTFSRTASESNTALFFSTLSFYLFSFYLIQKPKPKLLVFSFLSALIAFYTYPSSRLFIPGFLIIFFLLNLIFKFNSKFYLSKLSSLFIILVVLVSAVSFIPPQSRARADSISVFKNAAIRQTQLKKDIEILGYSFTPPLVTRSFFNKASVLVYELTLRYLSHFSPQYLFISGDIVPQNSVPYFGNFFIFELILLVFGFFYLGTQKNTPSLLVLALLIASPLPAFASIETPSSVRQLISLPGFIMAISLGASYLLSCLRSYVKPVAILILATLYLYFSVFLIVSLFQYKPYDSPWTSDQGTQDLVQKVWALKDKYQNIVIPRDPYINFLFFKQISPSDFLSRSDVTPISGRQWDRVNRLDNIIFNMDTLCPAIGKENILYICQGSDIPRNALIVDSIYFKDNVPAFTLIEFKPMPVRNQAKIPLTGHYRYMAPSPLTSTYPDSIIPPSEDRFF